MKLTVKSDEQLAVIGPKGIRIWLDDFEITRGVRRVELSVAIDDAPTATITLTPTEIDIDTAMIMQLLAWQHRDKVNSIKNDD